MEKRRVDQNIHSLILLQGLFLKIMESARMSFNFPFAFFGCSG